MRNVYLKKEGNKSNNYGLFTNNLLLVKLLLIFTFLPQYASECVCAKVFPFQMPSIYLPFYDIITENSNGVVGDK
jgi:hypothetical protein